MVKLLLYVISAACWTREKEKEKETETETFQLSFGIILYYSVLSCIILYYSIVSFCSSAVAAKNKAGKWANGWRATSALRHECSGCSGVTNHRGKQ